MFADAVMISEKAKSGNRMVDRVASVAQLVAPILGVDFPKGERAFVRLQQHGKLFVTKSPYDSIYFAKDHAREGQPRYRWVAQADGSEWGYLVEGAT